MLSSQSDNMSDGMKRWAGRVAMVTGASAGMGAAIVKALLKHGMVVVGLARRVEKVQALASVGSPGRLHAIKTDLRKEEDILAAFRWVKDNLGRIDVLINNAGVPGDTDVTEATTEEFRRIMDVNVMAPTLCTREAVQLMRQKGINDGHIIHVTSIAAYYLPEFSGSAIYFASKHAVRVLAEGLRKDLQHHNNKIRVTEIVPGLVATEFFDKRKMPKEKILSFPHIEAEDIADSVIFALSSPPNVEIFQLWVQPVGQASISEMRAQLQLKQ